MSARPPAAFDRNRARFSLTSLLIAVLTAALLLAAARQFLYVALRVDGAVAASFMVTIGWVVGTIVGSQRGVRWIVTVVCLAFYTALVNGMIHDVGDELTMWAFLCMSTGLIAGALAPLPVDYCKESEESSS